MGNFADLADVNDLLVKCRNPVPFKLVLTLKIPFGLINQPASRKPSCFRARLYAARSFYLVSGSLISSSEPCCRTPGRLLVGRRHRR